jgi:hypothetical protein
VSSYTSVEVGRVARIRSATDGHVEESHQKACGGVRSLLLQEHQRFTNVRDLADEPQVRSPAILRVGAAVAVSPSPR